jgi:hypothetical protein
MRNARPGPSSAGGCVPLCCFDETMQVLCVRPVKGPSDGGIGRAAGASMDFTHQIQPCLRGP